MTWRLARGLEKLRAQVNAKWPNRSKNSDGWIGDTSHSSRASDHNPDPYGVVKAIDITHDPRNGFNSYDFADMLKRNKDNRIKYCLVPGTRVLNANLEWKGIETFEVGDSLLAFDEYGPDKPWHAQASNKVRMSGLKFRTGIVEETEIIQRPCFEIRTDRGDVIASSDHEWLTDPSYDGKYRTWIETSELKPGVPLQYFSEPWERETDFDSGWLAGLFDGEGCLSRPRQGGWMLSVAQRDGIVLDRAVEILDRLGVQFEVYTNGKGDCRSIGIRGGLAGILRFLGRIQTVRLTHKAISQQIWNGYSITGTREKAVVESIKFLGTRDVIAMQTSSRTFLAEGIFSHNCISNRRIFSGNDGPRPWEWRRYTGSNPHDHHVHISIQADRARYDDVSDWNIEGVAAPPPEMVADYVKPRPTLSRGMQGEYVKVLQAALGFKGSEIDGHFGPNTFARLKQWQTDHHLMADGICGAQTWKTIK